MKKKLLSLFLFLIFSICSFADINGVSKLKKKMTYSQIENFVPYGWKIKSMTEGDLNKDNIKDVVLILENIEKENSLKIITLN